MPHLLPALLAAFILGGCADQPAPLTIEQRARFTTEMLEDEPACNALRQRLAAPSLTHAGIDAVYRDAKKATCLKRTV